MDAIKESKPYPVWTKNLKKFDLWDALEEDGPYAIFTVDRRHNQLNHISAINDNIISLMTHFGINPAHPGCWQALALILSAKYIPNFELKVPKSGRPIKWGPAEAAFLYAWVEMRRREPNPKAKTVLFKNIPKSLQSQLPEGHWTAYRDAYSRAAQNESIKTWVKDQEDRFGPFWMQRLGKKEIVIDWDRTLQLQLHLPIMIEVKPDQSENQVST